MQFWYELWDTETANMVAGCETYTEAARLIREYAEDNGEDSVRQWALLRKRSAAMGDWEFDGGWSGGRPLSDLDDEHIAIQR